QAILLIESPNKLQKSNAGAYGPFQLMKYVARKYGGLTVSKRMDERKDLYKSAFTASQYLKKVCIPQTKNILDNFCIAYSEQELWFKLLVMHVYHAGYGNVGNVLSVISPTEGGFSLIFKIWKTEAGTFKNASQNYSQVLLAALMEFHKIVYTESKDIRPGDNSQAYMISPTFE
ncbi:MAG: hypothetical protein HY738_04730, partial [Bacteroidia bacterium]|nr:hypothetical protein [Bacteroidia bacterium]